MGCPSLHPLFWDGPKSLAEIDLVLGGIGQLTFAHHGEKQQLYRRTDGGRCTNPPHIYISRISAGDKVRSSGSNLAMLVGLTRSVGFSTFYPRSMAQR